MNAIKLVLLSIFLLGSGNLLAAKAPKVLVCHVGGDGEINLILVSENSSHLGNPNHNFEDLTDYEPSDIGASGVGTEDIDGDGIDEGCEPPMGVACPCWEENDLMAVNAGNHDRRFSCGAVSILPVAARIQNFAVVEPEVEGSFEAFGNGSLNFCLTRDVAPFNVGVFISLEQAESCIGQIVDRCAAIGSPIIPFP